jgi:hypothetical protein
MTTEFDTLHYIVDPKTPRTGVGKGGESIFISHLFPRNFSKIIVGQSTDQSRLFTRTYLKVPYRDTIFIGQTTLGLLGNYEEDVKKDDSFRQVSVEIRNNESWVTIDFVRPIEETDAKKATYQIVDVEGLADLQRIVIALSFTGAWRCAQAIRNITPQILKKIT